MLTSPKQHWNCQGKNPSRNHRRQKEGHFSDVLRPLSALALSKAFYGTPEHSMLVLSRSSQRRPCPQPYSDANAGPLRTSRRNSNCFKIVRSKLFFTWVESMVMAHFDSAERITFIYCQKSSSHLPKRSSILRKDRYGSHGYLLESSTFVEVCGS